MNRLLSWSYSLSTVVVIAVTVNPFVRVSILLRVLSVRWWTKRIKIIVSWWSEQILHEVAHRLQRAMITTARKIT